MINYSFTYCDAAGGVIRATSMQCLTDADAIRQARETMADKYAALEILDGERAVYVHSPNRV